MRFNEMKKYIGTISYKTLSSTLKELEADQLVHREGVSTDSSEGGIQSDGEGKVTDSHSGRDVRMGMIRTGCEEWKL